MESGCFLRNSLVIQNGSYGLVEVGSFSGPEQEQSMAQAYQPKVSLRGGFNKLKRPKFGA